MNNNRIFLTYLITILIFLMASPIFAQTHLILGGEDEEDDAMVFRPRQIEEGPDGNLYVLDAGDSCIKVYSPDGEYLHKLGGPGEGPGEFQRTDGATFGFTTDDNLFFTEFFGGHRWLTIMELNGNLIRTLSPQLQVNYGIEAATSLGNGGFLVQFAYDSEAYATKNYYLYNMRQSLVEMDSLGAIVTEIVQTKNPAMISFTPNGGTSSLPFSPLFVWTSRQNNTIIWSDGMDPRFSVFDFQGQLLQEFDTGLPQPEKVTRDDLKQWSQDRKEFLVSRNPSWWNQYGRVIEDYEKSLFDKPILQRISAAPEDHLLVEVAGGFETGQKTYWLFDQQGAVVDTINSDVWALHISANYLLYFSEHEEGSTSVNVVKWSGNISESLSYLEAVLSGNDEK